MTFLILSGKEIIRDIKRVVCTLPIQAEATLEWEVTYLKSQTATNPCSWKKKLRCAQRKWTPSNSDTSSNNKEDDNYRRRSRTPPSETFSYDEEYHHKHKYKSSPRKGLGNDAMSKALNQISKSLFTHKIKRTILPRRFYQPTFTIYNGRTDPVKHVSQFN